MSWVRFDDQFEDDPEIDEICDSAVALHVCGIAWCSRNETDGFLPKDRAKRLKGGGNPKAIKDLLRVGWWLEVGNLYHVRNYLKYNKSKAQLEEERKKEADRVKKWRHGARRNTVGNTVSNTVRNAVTNGVSTCVRTARVTDVPVSRIPDENYKNNSQTPFIPLSAIVAYRREYMRKLNTPDEPHISVINLPLLRDWGDSMSPDEIENVMKCFFETDDQRVIDESYPVFTLVNSNKERWMNPDGTPKRSSKHASSTGRNGNGQPRADGSGVRATESDRNDFAAYFEERAETDISRVCAPQSDAV